ncbi:MAG TPA: hypothetical protein VIB82_01750, partial [Caulobacteraceae bacterium]
AALGASRRLVKAVNAVEAGKTVPPAQFYVFTPVATLLRFGHWDAILGEPPPPEALRLDFAVWLYARGFAHANKGDLAGAQADRDRLGNLVSADYSAYDPDGIPARQLVGMSMALLDGEIARKSGHLDAAIGHFNDAAALEAALPYTEPPYWHQPVAHILGAALIEAGRPAEAEAIYRQSLKTYRLDGWALFGLAQALDAQHKPAADARRAFRDAWRFADVTLTSSRF